MDYEDNKQSRFNAGIALTERIDSLQRAINAARFNPLQTNQDTMTLNYEVMVSANEGLLAEAWAKLNKEEQALADKIRLTIRQVLEVYPPISQDKNGEAQLNPQNYQKFLELINFFEKKNKEFLDTHNLNAPNQDYDDDEF